jgi:hypothetical protein|tara:strand:- start:1146 stop:1481 length:336 start_codon:yes stop_codon:yes gene_type:complete
MQRGLVKNERYKINPNQIHSYDRFEWLDWCENNVRGTEHAGKYQNGSCYKDVFLDVVRHSAVPVEAHKVNLEKDFWLPEEIEFVLNDAVKVWSTAKTLVNEIIPKMIPVPT